MDKFESLPSSLGSAIFGEIVALKEENLAQTTPRLPSNKSIKFAFSWLIFQFAALHKRLPRCYFIEIRWQMWIAILRHANIGLFPLSTSIASFRSHDLKHASLPFFSADSSQYVLNSLSDVPMHFHSKFRTDRGAELLSGFLVGMTRSTTIDSILYSLHPQSI